MKRKFSIAFAAACCSAPALTSPACAEVAAGSESAASQDSAASPGQGPGDQRATGSPWEFSITPYVWFSGLNGDVGAFPNVPPVQVDLSFGDVISNFKFGGMVALQARRGRFVALADITYVDLGTSEDVGIRDPDFLTVDLDTSSFSSTFAGGYRAIDQGPLFLDLVAGIRVSAVNTKLALAGPVRRLEADSSETWVDPVIGARMRIPLNRDWAFTLYGDVGGFGTASDFTWQVLPAIQYRLGRRWHLSAGWRHFEMDYEKEGFVYDVSMGGPIVGATFAF